MFHFSYFTPAIFKISLMECLFVATQKQLAQELSDATSPWRRDVKFVMSLFQDKLIYTQIALKV